VTVTPNDPNKECNWSYGFGKLTLRGRVQQLLLGQRLRNRYINHYRLVSPHYDSKEVVEM
jgi:hypothetical protein